ncbi:MAG: hypothetical protein ACJAXV_001102 [Bacteroidia bacterium]|jgi:hypothetical protein
MLVNIHTEKVATLKEGKYHINIVGGWGITLNGFSMELENLASFTITIPRRSFWPVQSFWKGSRAKRVFSFEITESGEYRLTFKNSDKLEVRHSNLRTLMHRLFAEPVENKNLAILLKRKGL